MMPQSHDDGELLVVAMTRPPMIGGLTLNSVVFSIFMPFMAAMIIKDMWVFLTIPLFLVGSYIICLKDVCWFDIAETGMYLRFCPNKNFWGCRRYASR